MERSELFTFQPGLKSRCLTGAVPVSPGQSVPLFEIEGPGILRRMWLTTNVRLDPRLHRGITLRLFWDGSDVPAVCVPFGDFFGHFFGDVEFESEFFSSPSERTYNCFIPMPFRTSARLVLTNETGEPLVFYHEINYHQTLPPRDALYFHAFWRREPRVEPGRDFVLLPPVRGRGRYLGTHCAVITNPRVPGSWSEGDYRVFVDGEAEAAVHSLASDDQIGCAWGQSKTFLHRSYGRWEARLYREGDQGGRHSFYRYHLADPVYFESELSVRNGVQGGLSAAELAPLFQNDAGIQEHIGLPEGLTWQGIEESAARGDALYADIGRSDDWSAVTLWYLDRPGAELPEYQGEEVRTLDMDF